MSKALQAILSTEDTTTTQAAPPKQVMPSASPAPAVTGKAEAAGNATVAPKQEVKMATVTPTAKPVEKPQRMSYEDIVRTISPNRPESPDEIARMEKKRRREAVIAALGDGLSSMANLFFAAKGAPSSFDKDNLLSKGVADRWAKLNADRKEKMKLYMDELERARQRDDTQRNTDRTFAWQQERAKVEDDRWAKQQERQDKEFEFKVSQAKKQEEQWQKTFENTVKHQGVADALAQATLSLQQYKAEQAAALGTEKARINATKMAGKLLGNPKVLTSDNMKITVYDNVWLYSMPQVCAAMAEELANDPDTNLQRALRAAVALKADAKCKALFVESYWHKSKKAIALLKEIAKTTPESLVSSVSSTADGSDDNTAPWLSSTADDDDDDNTMPSLRKGK